MARHGHLTERQQVAGGAQRKQCPWCGGELELRQRLPRQAMIPGEVRVWAEKDVPEALRTVDAWVCGTPHCKYRETA